MQCMLEKAGKKKRFHSLLILKGYSSILTCRASRAMRAMNVAIRKMRYAAAQNQAMMKTAGHHNKRLQLKFCQSCLASGAMHTLTAILICQHAPALLHAPTLVSMRYMQDTTQSSWHVHSHTSMPWPRNGHHDKIVNTCLCQACVSCMQGEQQSLSVMHLCAVWEWSHCRCLEVWGCVESWLLPASCSRQDTGTRCNACSPPPMLMDLTWL